MKRLVLVDSEGLHTIMGLSDTPDVPILINLPVVTVEATETTPEVIGLLALNLIKVKRTFALYREVIIPETSRLNETFDPRQV